jgi:PBP1b-binding outer membrane lipoprotein LpoB
MKLKKLLVIAAAVAVLFVSCMKESPVPVTDESYKGSAATATTVPSAVRTALETKRDSGTAN